MFLMLHVALVIHLLLLQNAFSCENWEYAIGSDCCAKCDPGSRVLRHCTSATSTTCVPCTPGSFTEHPNGLTICLKCRQCPPENHLQVKERCHYTKDAKCTCQPGFYCIHQLEADSCDVCERHTPSPPGFRVTRAGTETHDVSFQPCPPGTYSSKEMSFSCTKWTNCSEKGLIETHKGNATSDVGCGSPQPPRNTGIIVAFFFLTLVVLVPFLIFIVLRKRKCSRKATSKKKAEEGNLTVPEKEHMVTPIQETAPNLGQPSYAKC